MAYEYQHFIPQNTAPTGAKKIGVYNNCGEKICMIPIGRLATVAKDKLYSFGVLSDVHIQPYSSNALGNGHTIGEFISIKLEKSLKWFTQQGVSFVCVSGDTVNRGFLNSSGTFTTDEFEEYKRICNLCPTLPVYEICGNHESYNSNITNHLAELKTYTGADLYYSILQDNDVFLFLGQPQPDKPMSDEALQWCYETLEANRNRRCFVFVHPFITSDSGNSTGVYTSNQIFNWWGTKTTAFKNLLKHYKNTILFHGHSHLKFECQELDDTANYTEKNGFRSVHTPSLATPRDIVDGAMQDKLSEGYGYLVDVYDDCVVLTGMDFVNDVPIPLGCFEIDTSLVKIPAGTFTDSTGTITI